MNSLNQFLENATNEFGDKIDFSNIENEGFNGVVCLNDRSADISITIDSYCEFNNDLNDDEKVLLNAFIEFTQTQMQNANFFTQDIKKTQNSLCK